VTQKKLSTPTDQLARMKSWALKSGYPLENDVAKILSGFKRDRFINRNVTFHAQNEDGEEAIRSIDFKFSFVRGTQTIPDAGWPQGRNEAALLTFLIDAKYSEDETYWFTPIDKGVNVSAISFPHLIPMFVGDDYGREVKLYRSEFEIAAKVIPGWSMAGSGKKVKEQSKERNSLEDSQIQMMGALQAIVEEESHELGQPDKVDSSYSRKIHIYVPLIVTNAPLYILKQDLGSDEVDAASKTEQICSRVDRILVAPPHFFHVKEALRDLSAAIATHRGLSTKLAWLPQDLTAFPILFANTNSLASVMNELLTEFDTAVDARSQHPHSPAVAQPTR